MSPKDASVYFSSNLWTIHLLLLYPLAGTPWTSGQAANPPIPWKEWRKTGSWSSQTEPIQRQRSYKLHRKAPGTFQEGLNLWPSCCQATTLNHHNCRASKVILLQTNYSLFFITICVPSVKKKTKKKMRIIQIPKRKGCELFTPTDKLKVCLK